MTNIITPHPVRRQEEDMNEEMVAQIRQQMNGQKAMLKMLSADEEMLALEAEIATKRIKRLEEKGMSREEAINIVAKRG